MSFCRAVIALAFTLSTLFASYNANAGLKGKIDGTIKLYSNTYYKDRLLTVNIRFPNQCYHVDCDFLDNKIASAKWTGLPTTGIAGKAYIIFYEDYNCKGYATTITLPNFGGVRDFNAQKVKDNISSFMVKSENDLVDNGFANICSWTGSNVVGGSVSQDDPISMVNATV